MEKELSLGRRTLYNYEIIDVSGNISFDDTETIEKYISENISGEINHIVLNIENVPFINSSALAMLIKIMQKFLSSKISFHIMNANETIISLMRMTGVISHFEFIKNEESLLESLRKKELDELLEE